MVWCRKSSKSVSICFGGVETALQGTLSLNMSVYALLRYNIMPLLYEAPTTVHSHYRLIFLSSKVRVTTLTISKSQDAVYRPITDRHFSRYDST